MNMTEVLNTGALPPAPEPAGASEMPESSGSDKTGARRCRDCGELMTEPGRQLCARCRDAAAARYREQKRLYQRNRQADGKARRSKKKPGGAPRTCKTVGCGGGLAGRQLYCDACRSARQETARRKYRVSRYVDPLPFGPPTSMDWLRRFDAWTKSGLSYGAYQARERERPVRRFKQKAPPR
jgi:hypothetical protein